MINLKKIVIIIYMITIINMAEENKQIEISSIKVVRQKKVNQFLMTNDDEFKNREWTKEDDLALTDYRNKARKCAMIFKEKANYYGILKKVYPIIVTLNTAIISVLSGIYMGNTDPNMISQIAYIVLSVLTNSLVLIDSKYSFNSSFDKYDDLANKLIEYYRLIDELLKSSADKRKNPSLVVIVCESLFFNIMGNKNNDVLLKVELES
jgi:hypothetical protein